MTTANVRPINAYTANGATTVFAYTFKILQSSDIRVFDNGTQKVLSTDYTVSNVGVDGGGNVTFGIAPVSAHVVIFDRNTSVDQLTNWIDNDPFPADTVENALDKLTLLAQEFKYLKIPFVSAVSVGLSQASVVVTHNLNDSAAILVSAQPSWTATCTVSSQTANTMTIAFSANSPGAGSPTLNVQIWPTGFAAAIGEYLVNAHDHASAGDGGVLTADAHDSFSDYTEIAKPATPASGHVRLYPSSSTHRMTMLDSSAVETSLGPVGGELFGLTLSNNAGDATNDIDVTVGAATDSSGTIIMKLTTGLTKQLDVNWAVGNNAGMLDTGAVGNNSYHIFLIQRSDTGVTDILASLSASAPTMPASYDRKRRIMSFKRVAGVNQSFVQDGDYVRLKASVVDVAVTNPGTSAVSRTVSVPTGINVTVFGNVEFESTTGASALLLSDLAANDEAPSQTATPLCTLIFAAAAEIAVAGSYLIRTNTSAQIRSRVSVSDANTTLRISTLGWMDRRGKDA